MHAMIGIDVASILLQRTYLRQGWVQLPAIPTFKFRIVSILNFHLGMYDTSPGRADWRISSALTGYSFGSTLSAEYPTCPLAI